MITIIVLYTVYRLFTNKISAIYMIKRILLATVLASMMTHSIYFIYAIIP